MSKIIAFSGGCFSGKTTAIETVKANFINSSLDCIHISELIRDLNIVSIDELRKNANDYFDVQIQIITEKINQERAAADFPGIVLVDRAIGDSLYYLLYHVRYDALDNSRKLKYLDFVNFVHNHAQFAYRFLYTCVAFFKPLEKVCLDNVYRPENINITKHIESKCIDIINLAYCDSFKYLSFDLNTEDVNGVHNILINYLQ